MDERSRYMDPLYWALGEFSDIAEDFGYSLETDQYLDDDQAAQAFSKALREQAQVAHQLGGRVKKIGNLRHRTRRRHWGVWRRIERMYRLLHLRSYLERELQQFAGAQFSDAKCSQELVRKSQEQAQVLVGMLAWGAANESQMVEEWIPDVWRHRHG